MHLAPPEIPEKDYPIRWDECEDIKVFDDDGALIHNGPKFLRCSRQACNSLVTQGMILESGACWCGNRRLVPALKLTKQEKCELKLVYYPLNRWEMALIAPLCDGRAPGWGREDWKEKHGE